MKWDIQNSLRFHQLYDPTWPRLTKYCIRPSSHQWPPGSWSSTFIWPLLYYTIQCEIMQALADSYPWPKHGTHWMSPITYAPNHDYEHTWAQLYTRHFCMMYSNIRPCKQFACKLMLGLGEMMHLATRRNITRKYLWAAWALELNSPECYLNILWPPMTVADQWSQEAVKPV